MVAPFAYTTPGMEPELAALTPDELVQHYATHLRDFILDDHLGTAYLNRFLAEKDLQAHPGLTRCLIHLMGRIRQLLPFNNGVRSLYGQLFNDDDEKARGAVLAKLNQSPEYVARLQRLQDAGRADELHSLLLSHLRAEPANVVVAEMLLECSLSAGMYNHNLSTDWLHDFAPPELLQSDWRSFAMYRAARHGHTDLALQLWHDAGGTQYACQDIAANHVAACLTATGNHDAARMLYMRSLQTNPAQQPVQKLLHELDNPFATDPDSLSGPAIPVLIYTYNKADLLAQTLHSVCQSTLGTPDVIVLVNGCTDNSLEVVRKAQAHYPNIPIELINIPINMGAPAARNYLLHHVQQTRTFDYVAYLDDDVTLPENWLASLATAMREDPHIGVVGCRILNPDVPLQQYLYRDVSIVKPGLFRLGLATPHATRSIGLYNVRRDVDSVMGCCHLIRKQVFDTVPGFDIQFSPSQLDDVAFHVDATLKGWNVRYLGQLACIHHRATGFQKSGARVNGNSMGNDVKFYYRYQDHFDTLAERLRTRTNSFLQTLG